MKFLRGFTAVLSWIPCLFCLQSAMLFGAVFIQFFLPDKHWFALICLRKFAYMEDMWNWRNPNFTFLLYKYCFSLPSLDNWTFNSSLTSELFFLEWLCWISKVQEISVHIQWFFLLGYISYCIYQMHCRTSIVNRDTKGDFSIGGFWSMVL